MDLRGLYCWFESVRATVETRTNCEGSVRETLSTFNDASWGWIGRLPKAQPRHHSMRVLSASAEPVVDFRSGLMFTLEDLPDDPARLPMSRFARCHTRQQDHSSFPNSHGLSMPLESPCPTDDAPLRGIRWMEFAPPPCQACRSGPEGLRCIASREFDMISSCVGRRGYITYDSMMITVSLCCDAQKFLAAASRR